MTAGMYISRGFLKTFPSAPKFAKQEAFETNAVLPTG